MQDSSRIKAGEVRNFQFYPQGPNGPVHEFKCECTSVDEDGTMHFKGVDVDYTFSLKFNDEM